MLPVAEFAHGDDGCAVIGLGVYRGEEYPSLDGIYFNADLCTGQVRGLQRDENGVWQFQNLLDTALTITGAGQDENGTLYVAALASGRGGELEGRDGSLWKIVSADKVVNGATTAPLGERRVGNEPQLEGVGEPDADPAAQTDEEQVETAATPAATGPAAGGNVTSELNVIMSEMFFDPNQLRIAADTDVRVMLENRGAIMHNFEVRDSGISVDVEPGETAEKIVNLPAGKYQVICNVPGHKQAGMNAVILVR